MPSLFDDDPPPAPAAPTKMKSSHARVLGLLRMFGGVTSAELHTRQGMGWLSHAEVSLALADLRASGHVEEGISRKCEIKKSLMVTWWAK